MLLAHSSATTVPMERQPVEAEPGQHARGVQVAEREPGSKTRFAAAKFFLDGIFTHRDLFTW
jgi:hypothetical protein